MAYERTDARCRIADALQNDGYSLVEQGQDTADPFHWWIIARKGEYEIRVEERARTLCDF